MDAAPAVSESNGPRYDGVVSRHLNRRISRPVAQWLTRTATTPNQVTLATTLLALAAGAMVAVGWNIAGGIAIQASSIADGVDGELARLKGMATRFGGVLDAVLDRYADAAMLGGMTVYAVRFEDLPRPEVVGILALAGALSVSYSRARIEASLGVEPGDWIFGLASRDVRLLVAAVGAVAGLCYWALTVLAVASWATVAWRLVALRWRAEP
ncbi:MAG: CDP-alcohol phosphatidyltransferase family protein [Dehalococcoidia bacterium]